MTCVDTYLERNFEAHRTRPWQRVVSLVRDPFSAEYPFHLSVPLRRCSSTGIPSATWSLACNSDIACILQSLLAVQTTWKQTFCSASSASCQKSTPRLISLLQVLLRGMW